MEVQKPNDAHDKARKSGQSFIRRDEEESHVVTGVGYCPSRLVFLKHHDAQENGRLYARVRLSTNRAHEFGMLGEAVAFAAGLRNRMIPSLTSLSRHGDRLHDADAIHPRKAIRYEMPPSNAGRARAGSKYRSSTSDPPAKAGTAS